MKRKKSDREEMKPIESYVVMDEVCPNCENTKMLPITIRWGDSGSGLMFKQKGVAYCECDEDEGKADLCEDGMDEILFMLGEKDWSILAEIVHDNYKPNMGGGIGNLEPLCTSLERLSGQLSDLSVNLENAESDLDNFNSVKETVKVLKKLYLRRRSA